jgi:hypothetical protein
MRTGTSSLMDGKNYTKKKVMRIDDINEIADEQIKQNVQKLIDKDIFNQAILAMEEMYGSGCDEEIDAYFRGAKWMQQEMIYSEKEVLQLLLRLQQTESYDNLYDWFEQFKKK